MSLSLSDIQRRLIPRWRDYNTTVTTGELGRNQKLISKPLIDDRFYKLKLSAWRENKSIEFAVDLVSTAIIIGEYEASKEAAEFLVNENVPATLSVKSLAELILEKGKHKYSSNNFGELASKNQVASIRATTNLIKSQLSLTPRNSLLWVDLSRLYVLQNQSKQAYSAMEKALILSPYNRFILRSASRLFVHHDDLERAQGLLVNKSWIREDPWLLSAEIAVSEIANKTSKNIKFAKRLMRNDSYSDFHTSELAGALATVELIKGSQRNSRKFFNASLIDPTENSVAQAEWALTKLNAFDIDEEKFDTPRTFEARAKKGQRELKWDVSANNSYYWMHDEPFSSRPAILGSYVTAMGSKDYKKSEEFCNFGLHANPNDPILLNNLAFSLANQNNVDEAMGVIESIGRKLEDPTNECAVLATTGLINFRAGNVEIGRAYYEEAISFAANNSLANLKSIAQAFLAKEEILANTEESGPGRNLLKDISQGHKDPEIRWLAADILESEK